MRDGLRGGPICKSYCLGTVLLVKVRGLRELRMANGFMADGLVEAENRKGSFWYDD